MKYMQNVLHYSDASASLMFDRCNGVAQVISWIRIGISTDFTEEERMDFTTV